MKILIYGMMDGLREKLNGAFKVPGVGDTLHRIEKLPSLLFS